MQLALGFDVVKADRKVEPRSVNARAGGSLTLTKLDERVHAYTEAAHSKNTQRAYRGDWATFERWCKGQGECALPASTATLARYLAHLADNGKKASTIRRARIAVGLAHAWEGVERPDRDIQIRTIERGIARTHGSREEGADALLSTDLPKVMGAIRGGPRADRDRALILLGFAGAFRASELVGLDVEHLHFHAEGVRVLVARSKEDQLGKGALVNIDMGKHEHTCPVRALRQWIERVGRPSGPLFRVVRGSVIEHQRMHVGAVNRAVDRACARAQLEGEYSAHSLRVGLATSARLAGHPIEAIQHHGRWLDRRSVERYFRAAPIYNAHNPARGLL